MASGTYFSLMTITIPFWQCLPCAQYSQMGVLSTMGMVYSGAVVASAATGINPVLMAVTFVPAPIGTHGASKVDWVTVWFPTPNWNWTMSPTSALRLFGEKVRVLVLPETQTTWTLTCPWSWAKVTEVKSAAAARVIFEKCIVKLVE